MREVVGDFGSTSHRANVRRVGGAFAGNGCSAAGTPGLIALPGFSQSPRLSRRVSRISLRASRTICDVDGSGCCLARASIFSLVSLNSGTVVRQKLKTALACAGERFSRGIDRISRTAFGSGSATGFVAAVYERRKRPRLLVIRSSLFQPPWFCFSRKTSCAPFS